MGGDRIVSSLARPLLKKYSAQMQTFLSLAGPHLGVKQASTSTTTFPRKKKKTEENMLNPSSIVSTDQKPAADSFAISSSLRSRRIRSQHLLISEDLLFVRPFQKNLTPPPFSTNQKPPFVFKKKNALERSQPHVH